jgi:putative hydrolase of the HAD superfamily
MQHARKIKAVVFDLGYTLINFNGNLQEVARESYQVLADGLVKHGCEMDSQVFAARFNELMRLYYAQRENDLLECPVYEIVNRALNELGQSGLPMAQVIEALHEMYRYTERNWQLEGDTLAMLADLKESGYQLGLISNASDAWDVNNLIDGFQLRDFFEVILISADEGIRKPDRRIFERAATAMQCDFHAMVMVGDTLDADIFGAKQCGMKTVWISRRAEESRYKLRVRPELNADAEIKTLSELPKLIESWNK